MRIVISLGGSVIVPDKIDIDYLNNFREYILNKSEEGYSFVIIVGGGSIARYYRDSACEISDILERDKHMIGVQSTRLNGELVRSLFGKNAYHKLAINYERKLNTKNKIIVGAGYKPGTTSDYESVRWAKNFGVNRVINISNIKGVLLNDEIVSKISWNYFRTLIGEDNKGGGCHFPFGPYASKFAQKEGIEAIVINNDLKNLDNCIDGKKFLGTTIY